MTTATRSRTRGFGEGTRAGTVLYWATTMIIAVESAVGGLWDVLRTDHVRDVLELQLGYPWYVAIIIGVGKLPGAVVLLAPRLPRLKEWVYAGVAFIYLGAVASHLLVEDYAAAVGPLGFAVLTFISWATRPPARRDLTARPPVRPMSVGYWATTAVVVAVLFSGGLADLAQHADTSDGVRQLGYPSYFLHILGIWKVLGAAALAVPRCPRLKEWAYAGAFYNFAGACVSHVISHSGFFHVLVTGTFAVVTLASWALRPDSRVVPGQRALPALSAR